MVIAVLDLIAQDRGWQFATLHFVSWFRNNYGRTQAYTFLYRGSKTFLVFFFLIFENYFFSKKNPIERRECQDLA